MIKNYFKIAWQILVKNKVISIISLPGLSIGITDSLRNLQYESFLLGFDNVNKIADEIYRVTNNRYQNYKLIQHSSISYSSQTLIKFMTKYLQLKSLQHV